jgi:hypothetical protein
MREQAESITDCSRSRLRPLSVRYSAKIAW